jgi:sugar phosphate isomerase/epimerase
MNRRKFLVGTAASAAALAGLSNSGWAQGQAPAGRGGQGGRGGGGRGRGSSAADASAAVLARIGIMTLNHSNMIKMPWQEATAERTLDILDVPQYYVEEYGVTNIEFQDNHVVQDDDNPEVDLGFVRELKARLDAAGSKGGQINIEIGTMAQAPDGGGPAAALSGDERAAWIATAKKWVDLAPILGVERLMLNQGALTDDSKAGVISMWKELQDYATPKGVKISGETRGSGTPSGIPAPTSEQERLRYVWGIVVECAEASGGYTNLDFGSASRFRSQQQLHDGIQGMLPRAAGSMHIRMSPTWDLGQAIRYAESIGYTGLYTIEVRTDPAVRQIYNTIVANLTQLA